MAENKDEQLTDEELASKPVGSGPWCYETINAADGGRISFTANHRYTGPWPATCLPSAIRSASCPACPR